MSSSPVSTRSENWRNHRLQITCFHFVSFFLTFASSLQPGLLLFFIEHRVPTCIWIPNSKIELAAARRSTEKIAHFECETTNFVFEKKLLRPQSIHTFEFDRRTRTYSRTNRDISATEQWKMVAVICVRDSKCKCEIHCYFLSALDAPMPAVRRQTKRTCICLRWWITSKEKFACCALAVARMQFAPRIVVDWMSHFTFTRSLSAYGESRQKSNCHFSIGSISSNCS